MVDRFRKNFEVAGWHHHHSQGQMESWQSRGRILDRSEQPDIHFQIYLGELPSSCFTTPISSGYARSAKYWEKHRRDMIQQFVQCFFICWIDSREMCKTDWMLPFPICGNEIFHVLIVLFQISMSKQNEGVKFGSYCIQKRVTKITFFLCYTVTIKTSLWRSNL